MTLSIGMNLSRRNQILVLVVLAAGGLWSSGCGKKKGPPLPPPASVTVVKPVLRETVEWSEYTGRLRSPEAVEIRPRVGGYLESINFHDGQTIQKGDLLFVIDPRPFQASLDAATAAVAQAEAQEKLAQANFSRAVELRKKGAIAQEQFDTNANDLKVAIGAVTSARAGQATGKLNLSFTQVTAPVSGKIGRHQISVGNLVSPDTTLLTTIVSLDPIYCYFEMDERSYLQSIARTEKSGIPTQDLAIGVEMELAGETNFPHRGKLDFIDNQLDDQTATIELRAIFENAGMLLTPGLFARARIPVREKYEAVLIPDEAVGSDQSVQFVYVVGSDNKAQRRPVELGPLSEGLRVVRKGITANDRIIALGVVKVLPGATVKVTDTTIEEMQKTGATSQTDDAALDKKPK